jgi:hypothetical protein
MMAYSMAGGDTAATDMTAKTPAGAYQETGNTQYVICKSI